ncbi:hypothetical protein ERO13_A08G062601v2 [Gossypium hirsutum]|uniref:Uncharacterized protein n=1 Tax=Gossypium tomentosum TaxID=34277 RepID=A0A5D2PBS5_GOSTO|nr:hypothetical protein ERO13_A08G062601v2 [Gossypium hirsutum]TYI13698.1 hypothetical protein ES332_A08G075400v1 [Gossypium tomentosum]
MQPSNHHHTVADGAQARADFTNRRELRLCPWYAERGSKRTDVERAMRESGVVRGGCWWLRREANGNLRVSKNSKKSKLIELV